MGLFGRRKKRVEEPKEPEEKDTRTLQELNAQEKGDVEELLSKLYLLSNAIIEIKERYVKPLVGVHNVVDHQDTLTELFDAVKRMHDLFGVVDKTSSRTILLAKDIKARMQEQGNLKSEHEFLAEEKSTFAVVLDMEPRLKKINDGVFFCLQTVQEMRAYVRQEQKAIHEHEIETEMAAILQQLETIRPLLDTLIESFRHLVHLNNKYSQGNLKKTVQHDLAIEKQDLRALSMIYKYCADQLARSRLMLWTIDSGKKDFIETLNKVILPKLQKGLAYEKVLEHAVKDIQDKTAVLPREKNADLRRDQLDLERVTKVLRLTFQKINTNTIPGIIRNIEQNQSHAQTEHAIQSLIALFEALEKKVLKVRKLLEYVHEVYTKEEQMAVND